tara:strand:+ start:13259 stop:14194 length:936 start_codon:yes stop_codon:yes gene_type:complete
MKYVIVGDKKSVNKIPKSPNIEIKQAQTQYKTTLLAYRLPCFPENYRGITWGVQKQSVKYTRYKGLVGNKFKYVYIYEVGCFNRNIYKSVCINKLLGNSPVRPKDEAVDRFLKMNINHYKSDTPKNTKGSYILVCAQVPTDTQVQHINYNAWIYETVKTLLGKNYKVLYRKHPKYNTSLIKELENHENLIMDSNTLEKSISNAYVVVAFNSNCLLDAILQGVPIFAFDNTSSVYDLANHTFDTLDAPYFPSYEVRLQTFANIAYTQWTDEEIRNGKHFEYYENLITCYENSLPKAEDCTKTNYSIKMQHLG